MSLYNSNGQINTTVVNGSSYTGAQAVDGSWNIVLNNGNSYTGLYHPCGAYNAVVVNNPDSATCLATNGSLNVSQNLASYSPVTPRGVLWDLVINGGFTLNPVSGSQNTILNNWEWNAGVGTGTVVWNGTNQVRITGDGTNAALITTQIFIPRLGPTYTITFTTDQTVSISIGTAAFGSQISSQFFGSAGNQTYQFTPTVSNPWITFSRIEAGGGVGLSAVSCKTI